MIEAEAARLGSRWNESMLRGDFEHAWQASDAIRALGVHDPHRFWDGSPIAGRHVMLRCLHGFGDAIQLLRYVPRLRESAASVCVEIAPRLVELACCLRGVEQVITWGEQAPAHAPRWNQQIEVMELPYIFRTALADLPIAENYLRLPAATLNRPHTPLLRVGIMLTAGEWNVSRSITEALCSRLITTAGCEFWNLGTQPSACAMREDEQVRRSVIALAQLVSTLDLVITVDTLAAHLAGAIGVPAWVMLQHQPDWRWMNAREDSPWYPSLRLFRQSAPGDWQEVISRVVAALQQLTASRAERSA